MILENQRAENWQNSPMDTQNYLEQMLFNSFPGIKINNIVPFSRLLPTGESYSVGNNTILFGTIASFDDGMSLGLFGDSFGYSTFGSSALALFDTFQTGGNDVQFVGYKITYEDIPKVEIAPTIPDTPTIPTATAISLYVSNGTNLEGKNYIQAKALLAGAADKLRVKCPSINLDIICDNGALYIISEAIHGDLIITGHCTTAPTINGTGETFSIVGDYGNFGWDNTDGDQILTAGVGFGHVDDVTHDVTVPLGVLDSSKSELYFGNENIFPIPFEKNYKTMFSFPTKKYLTLIPSYNANSGKTPLLCSFQYLLDMYPNGNTTTETIGNLEITRDSTGKLIKFTAKSHVFCQVFKKQKTAGTWFNQDDITEYNSGDTIFTNFGGDSSHEYKVVFFDDISGDTIIKQTIIDYIKI